MKNKEIKNKVLRDIKLSKLTAESVADKNLERAMENNEFKTLYIKIKQLNFDIAKKEFLNLPTAEDKKQLKQTKAEIALVMKKNNIVNEDLKPKYFCKKCQDTGFINEEYCECYYKRLNKAIINNLGVNVDNSHTFKNADFSIFDNPENIKKMYDKIENWCENITTSKYKNMLISGDTGVGKTYLLDSICNKLIEKNVVVNYYTAFALSDLFLKYRSSFSEAKAGLLDGVLTCDVLIIDDLGSESNIKNNEEYFYSLFNERLVKNKSTIITSNLNMEQLLYRYGERTFSRLCNKANSVIIKIDNKDLRLTKK